MDRISCIVCRMHSSIRRLPISSPPFAATNDVQNVEYQASGEEYQREGKEKVDFHGWLLSYKNAGTSS